MKLLLIGPYPPPHGGISVHVAETRALVESSGAECRVLNINPRAEPSPHYERVRNGADLARMVARYARSGWTLHLHINGHNRKAWLIAFVCGVFGRAAPSRLLTLHSGLAPSYLGSGGTLRRALLRPTCRLYPRIVCVSRPIQEAVLRLGIDAARLRILPAFVPRQPSPVPLGRDLEEWIGAHSPVLSTTLFFRPEYGFDLLVRALALLRARHPDVGCLVMGSREGMQSEKARVARTGLASHVWFLGDVEHAACLFLMSRSNVYVRPTLVDGDSVSVREALHLGVPVVASNVGVRPPSAALFEAGNAEDLVEVVERVLSRGGPPSAPKPRAHDDRDTGALLDLYGGLPAPGSTKDDRAERERGETAALAPNEQG